MTLKEIKMKHGLTGARIGLLTGVTPRTVRSWLAPVEAGTYTKMPASCWRLLRVLLGEATPEDVIREAEASAAENDTIQTARRTAERLTQNGGKN
jgi:hypothetical protein